MRKAEVPGPRWHCPHCHNEYPSLLPPLPEAASYQAKSDSSLFGLVAANAVTIVATLWFEFDLNELMLIYWLQSVMIGISFFVRMVFQLRRGSAFSAGDDVDDRSLQALFFLVHYGGFQLGHLIFIAPAAFPGIFSVIGLCALAFAFSHGYSLWRNIRLDRIGGVDFSTLFWLPYARVIPMHLTIILGPRIAGGEFALLLFLGLKTFADVLMHAVEHRVLQRA